jgi:hypothetical protein
MARGDEADARRRVRRVKAAARLAVIRHRADIVATARELFLNGAVCLDGDAETLPGVLAHEEYFAGGAVADGVTQQASSTGGKIGVQRHEQSETTEYRRAHGGAAN